MMHEKLNRRDFIRMAGVASVGMMTAGQAWARSEDKPNILWVTSEDNGPALGCYGDAFADTPNIDSIAAIGMIYERAWSNAPVCAPARTTIISGVYPPSLGAQHMRSQVDMPSFMKMYPQFLREAGYYCTNNTTARTIRRKTIISPSPGRCGMIRAGRGTGEIVNPDNPSSQYSTLLRATRARFANGLISRFTTLPK